MFKKNCTRFIDFIPLEHHEEMREFIDNTTRQLFVLTGKMLKGEKENKKYDEMFLNTLALIPCIVQFKAMAHALSDIHDKSDDKKELCAFFNKIIDGTAKNSKEVFKEFYS
jgi:hypothetical protein